MKKLLAEDPLVEAFAEAAETHRAWLSRGLAETEYEEGLYVDEAEIDALVDQDEARLAAKSGGRELPAEYRGGGWFLRMGLTALGVAYVELVSGPGPLQVFERWLGVGERAELPDVEAPEEVVGVDESGGIRVLR
ncbi:MAG TPA: hypothetical protein QGF58_14700 [Myxococcota bacterium]|jgi:hypothetical protein|nr:hypothetical protein [Myxococcota bacterium]